MPDCTNEVAHIGKVGRRVIQAAFDGGDLVSVLGWHRTGTCVHDNDPHAAIENRRGNGSQYAPRVRIAGEREKRQPLQAGATDLQTCSSTRRHARWQCGC